MVGFKISENHEKISKPKDITYPILRLKKDDIINIYKIFKDNCSNVGAVAEYKNRAYQIEDEKDFDIKERNLDYFEIVGYNPFVSLLLGPSKAYLYISDTSEKKSMIIERDINYLLNDRLSGWNDLFSPGVILTILAVLVIGFLFYGAQNNVVFASLFIVIAEIFAMAWFYLRSTLRDRLHCLIRLVAPEKTSGHFTLQPYLNISINWGEIVRYVGKDAVSNIIKIIISLILSGGFFFLVWLFTHIH